MDEEIDADKVMETLNATELGAIESGRALVFIQSWRPKHEEESLDACRTLFKALREKLGYC